MNAENNSLYFDLGLPDASDKLCGEKEYKKAVDDAINSFSEHIHSDASVCIIVDDYTRATPTAKILTFLLPVLEEQGIKKENIFFLFASGSHRLMNENEKRQRLSDSIYENYRSLDHRFFDPAHLVKIGSFEDGVPIFVNKHAIEADIRIAIGSLVPHMPAGFSGGAKMLLPGIAGQKTVYHMHILGALDPNQAIGVIDTLPRKLMEYLASKTAEPFTIINVVLNSEDKPVGIVGGHYIEAHRRGVEIAKQIYFVKAPGKADLVISDTRTHDADMTQANKGLFSAALVVKDGGEIVLVSDCPDGISPVHGEEMLSFGLCTNEEVKSLLESGKMKDPLAAIEILHNNVVRKKAKLYLHSPNISKEEAEKMNFEYVENLQEFIDKRKAKELKIGRLRASTFLVPFVDSDE